MLHHWPRNQVSSFIEEPMPKLYEEDQARVDAVLQKGVYKIDRKPFRPWMLLLIIFLVLGGITGVSFMIAAMEGFV